MKYITEQSKQCSTFNIADQQYEQQMYFGSDQAEQLENLSQNCDSAHQQNLQAKSQNQFSKGQAAEDGIQVFEILEEDYNKCIDTLQCIFPNKSLLQILKTISYKMGYDLISKNIPYLNDEQQHEFYRNNEAAGKVKKQSNLENSSSRLQHPEHYICPRRKFTEDRLFRQQQIAVAKLFVSGRFSKQQLTLQNPHLQIDQQAWVVHCVSITNKAILNIETYIMANTDRYLIRTKNSERISMRTMLWGAKQWLNPMLLETFEKFIRLHYKLDTFSNLKIDPTLTIKLYEAILTVMQQKNIVLDKKQTTDVNFYSFKSYSSAGYVLSQRQMNDLQKYAVQYSTLYDIQRLMSEKYKWQKRWATNAMKRRKFILDKLYIIMKIKLENLDLISSLPVKDNFNYKFQYTTCKNMILSKQKQVKILLNRIFNFIVDDDPNILEEANRLMAQFFELEQKMKSSSDIKYPKVPKKDMSRTTDLPVQQKKVTEYIQPQSNSSDKQDTTNNYSQNSLDSRAFKVPNKLQNSSAFFKTIKRQRIGKAHKKNRNNELDPARSYNSFEEEVRKKNVPSTNRYDPQPSFNSYEHKSQNIKKEPGNYRNNFTDDFPGPTKAMPPPLDMNMMNQFQQFQTFMKYQQFLGQNQGDFEPETRYTQYDKFNEPDYQNFDEYEDLPEYDQGPRSKNKPQTKKIPERFDRKDKEKHYGQRNFDPKKNKY